MMHGVDVGESFRDPLEGRECGFPLVLEVE